MKFYFPILALAVLAFAFSAFQASEQLGLAMKAGNANEVAKNFGPNVELQTPEIAGTYSKAQSTQVLKKFFASYPPTSYTVQHKGTSKLGMTYQIAELQTSNGNFRVSVFFKKEGDSEVIQSMQFDEE